MKRNYDSFTNQVNIYDLKFNTENIMKILDDVFENDYAEFQLEKNKQDLYRFLYDKKYYYFKNWDGLCDIIDSLI
jgi:hypothetical protein